jgi:PHS family inorganic phosphate transporter-like MFS transporter
MTAVFMCQPLGQLAATLVALIAVSRQRSGIPADATIYTCNAECRKTLDSVWRWIIGVGVIPAVIALWFRLTIIESPRYTADVGGDIPKAYTELNQYLPRQSTSVRSSSSSVEMTMEDAPLNQRVSHCAASEDGTTLQDPSRGNSQFPPTADDDAEAASIANTDEHKVPPQPSWRDFKDYFWHNGNIRTLMATSLCWFFVDLCVNLS